MALQPPTPLADAPQDCVAVWILGDLCQACFEQTRRGWGFVGRAFRSDGDQLSDPKGPTYGLSVLIFCRAFRSDGDQLSDPKGPTYGLSA